MGVIKMLSTIYDISIHFANIFYVTDECNAISIHAINSLEEATKLYDNIESQLRKSRINIQQGDDIMVRLLKTTFAEDVTSQVLKTKIITC